MMRYRKYPNISRIDLTHSACVVHMMCKVQEVGVLVYMSHYHPLNFCWSDKDTHLVHVRARSSLVARITETAPSLRSAVCELALPNVSVENKSFMHDGGKPECCARCNRADRASKKARLNATDRARMQRAFTIAKVVIRQHCLENSLHHEGCFSEQGDMISPLRRTCSRKLS